MFSYTWSQYYNLNKDTMSMYDMVREYNRLIDIKPGDGISESEVVEPTNFLLQENGDYLLQENGDKIIL